MCHPVMTDGRVALSAASEAVDIPLASGELMPAELVTPGPEWTLRSTAEPSAEAGSGAAPAVVVIADVYGPSDFYRDLCARLAACGLEAIMPDYFSARVRFASGPWPPRRRDATDLTRPARSTICGR